MTRPTSLCRSCSLNVVILPLGISVSTASSGNSTNWRITNSRNSLMTEKLSTNEHESTRISAWNQKRRRLTQTALRPQRPQAAATTHFDHRFSSPSVPHLLFLRRVALAPPPVLLPRARVQAAQA